MSVRYHPVEIRRRDKVGYCPQLMEPKRGLKCQGGVYPQTGFALEQGASLEVVRGELFLRERKGNKKRNREREVDVVKIGT